MRKLVRTKEELRWSLQVCTGSSWDCVHAMPESEHLPRYTPSRRSEVWDTRNGEVGPLPKPPCSFAMCVYTCISTPKVESHDMVSPLSRWLNGIYIYTYSYDMVTSLSPMRIPYTIYRQLRGAFLEGGSLSSFLQKGSKNSP